ncbi:MAG: ABC transporter permease [Mesorhizobium sp.]
MQFDRAAFIQGFVRYAVAVLLVLAIGSLILALDGKNPVEVFAKIIERSAVGEANIGRSLRWAAPVIIAGLAGLVAWRSGALNLGIDGQIYLGAFVGAVAGYAIEAPAGLHIPIAILCGAAAGAAWTLLPALLKLFVNVNEMVTTLMMNYIAVYLTTYLTIMLIGQDASNTNPDYLSTQKILDTAKLARLLPPSQVSTSLFMALGLSVLIFLVLRFSTSGYEMNMTGRNERNARYAGISTKTLMLGTFLASGAIAGVAGATEILGVHYKFQPNFATGLGWDGIMVMLIAKMNPLAVVLVGLLWGMLKNGAFAIERELGVNRMMVIVLQALFVLFVTTDLRVVFKLAVQGLRKRFRSPAPKTNATPEPVDK